MTVRYADLAGRFGALVVDLERLMAEVRQAWDETIPIDREGSHAEHDAADARDLRESGLDVVLGLVEQAKVGLDADPPCGEVEHG